MPNFTVELLTRVAESLFQAAGVPEPDAKLVARSLIDANLCGHDSHGIMRVPQYIGFLRNGTYRTAVPLTKISETPAVLTTDANWGLGQVQTYRLLEQLVPKANTLGIAAGTLANCGHVGRLGEYAEYLAEKRLALFAAVNSHGAGRRVAPPGGTQGRISTNPICFGTPTSTDPVVLDFGTSAVAEGKVRAQFQKKQPAPEGWLIDSSGMPTTDPAVLYQEPAGSLLPFGGPQAYKGFGLGLIVDLLCGGLSGGPCSNPKYPIPGQGNAAIFVLFDPVHFAGLSHFIQETDGLTEYLRSCPTISGMGEITLPGEPERTTKTVRLANGIDVPAGTWDLLVRTAGELGVELPGSGSFKVAEGRHGLRV